MPGAQITENALSSIMTGIVARGNEELMQMDHDGLEQYWHFAWEEKFSAEKNTYLFYDRIKLYAHFCRRWEEMHGGTCCVVERVRDKYLMPKIREFLKSMEAAADKNTDPEETMA